MFFAIITLLTALALASVAGWFSIIGIMAILAGAPIHALVAGVTIEVAKLITTSWIYRNWQFASFKLRFLLIFFTAIIMLVTSMGVFGFLSKAHLEQGASTIDNGAKVVRIEEQIAREKSSIDDNQKIIGQLDQVVQVLTDAQRVRGRTGSIAVRKDQEEQRTQLRTDIEAAQKRIDELSQERFALQSEVRKLELEVGPIRYIAEVIYGAENNSNQHVESAVRIFILLLVLTLDPLAVTLLIAANNSFMRRRDEKDKKIQGNQEGSGRIYPSDPGPNKPTNIENVKEDVEEAGIAGYVSDNNVSGVSTEKTEVPDTLPKASVEEINEETENVVQTDNKDVERGDGSIPYVWNPQIQPEVRNIVETGTYQDPTTSKTEVNLSLPPLAAEEDSIVFHDDPLPVLPVIRSPKLTRVSRSTTPWMLQSPTLEELLGSSPHFIPQKLSEEDKLQTIIQNIKPKKEYPKTLSWLNEFRRK